MILVLSLLVTNHEQRRQKNGRFADSIRVIRVDVKCFSKTTLAVTPKKNNQMRWMDSSPRNGIHRSRWRLSNQRGDGRQRQKFHRWTIRLTRSLHCQEDKEREELEQIRDHGRGKECCSKTTLTFDDHEPRGHEDAHNEENEEMHLKQMKKMMNIN